VSGSRSRGALTIVAAALLALCVGAAPAWAGSNGGKEHKGHHTPAPLGGATVTTVATGLDNPRDLAFGPGGKLYLAEAGHGAEPGSTECIPGGGPAGETTCAGFTSGISRIDSSGVHRILSGIISLAEPSGFGATGVDGVSLLGDGDILGIVTGSANAVPPQAGEFLSAGTIEKGKAQLGRLLQTNPSGHYKVVANVGGFDFQWSEEHKSLVPEQFPDANPYAVLAGSSTNWVIDAASNTLDSVSRNGAVNEVAFFPNPPVSDAVPTCIDRGPDGAFYVSQLGGAGNAPGASNVYRVVPGQEPTVWASGLTSVTGCGFGADGQFYAVEFSNKNLIQAEPGTGEVVRVPAGSTSPTPIVENLSFPGGFAAGANGALYVSNWSIAPANSGGGPTGEVIRITP
jgi:hypothetical protein